MIWYDLVRFGTVGYVLVRFRSVYLVRYELIRTLVNTFGRLECHIGSYLLLRSLIPHRSSLHAATNRPRSPAETVKTRKEITFDPINFLTMHFSIRSVGDDRLTGVTGKTASR